MDISIIILNYNGWEFLRNCLISINEALKIYNRDCEVIVVDNGSTDQSIDYISSNFPYVEILTLKQNLSFTKAMNKGIRKAKYPVVICLNNDVILDKNFITPLIKHFYSMGNIFAVAAKMLLWDKKTLNFGRVTGEFRYGFFTRKIFDASSSGYTLYACAGGFAVNRDKFLELGGFDEDINVYWEDLDLCYRAWKRGWETIYEPESIIFHKLHGTNLKQYGQKGIDALSGKNYFLFVIKNIHDRKLIFQQLASLPALIFASVLAGKPYFAVGLIWSFKKLSLFLKKRFMEKQKSFFSDRDVLSMSGRL